jgi:hypothetical protein
MVRDHAIMVAPVSENRSRLTRVNRVPSDDRCLLGDEHVSQLVSRPADV